jgi:hypothetical protein
METDSCRDAWVENLGECVQKVSRYVRTFISIISDCFSNSIMIFCIAGKFMVLFIFAIACGDVMCSVSSAAPIYHVRGRRRASMQGCTPWCIQPSPSPLSR